MKVAAFLVSGGGGNLKFFDLALRSGYISGLKIVVIADRECGAYAYARGRGLECYLIEYTRSSPDALIKILDAVGPDVIVTSWCKIIDQATVVKYFGKLINLHYSLLPAFGGLIGLAPIKRAYDQGCKYIGPTCHLVDEGVDTGKIIYQAVFDTNRPFDESVQLMFKKGCLVLLAGVCSVCPGQISIGVLGGAAENIFPALGFDENAFGDGFWREVAEA